MALTVYLLHDQEQLTKLGESTGTDLSVTVNIGNIKRLLLLVNVELNSATHLRITPAFGYSVIGTQLGQPWFEVGKVDASSGVVDNLQIVFDRSGSFCVPVELFLSPDQLKLDLEADDVSINASLVVVTDGYKVTQRT